MVKLDRPGIWETGLLAAERRRPGRFGALADLDGDEAGCFEEVRCRLTEPDLRVGVPDS